MRKFKMVVEYDGTRYCGWQIQPNGTTIQEALERVLSTITKERVTVIGAGRTDSGVHSEGQTAHFVTASTMTDRQFLKAINRLLPHDISVHDVKETSPEFDARRDAVRKIYRYTILNRDYPSALNYSRSLFVPQPLDVEVMACSAQVLVGRHDFAAFQAVHGETKTTVREIYRIDFTFDAGFIHITFEGNGFLKYMVRNIVGTLVEMGKGNLPEGAMREILESCDRYRAGPTAQPQGLCLVRVVYAGEPDAGGPPV
jgi:tRNA pseudouridine38-40 synthase